MDNKGLISQDKLCDIMGNHLKQELDECEETGGSWRYGSLSSVFSWKLYDSLGYLNRHIAARLCDDQWEIYNNYYDDKDVNIKVFEDHVEFIEESDFDDFSKDFMRGLYEKIKEYVDKKLISKDELLPLIEEWITPILNECEHNGRLWHSSSNDECFGWFMMNNDDSDWSNLVHEDVVARLYNDRWDILSTRYGTFTHVEIFDDHIVYDPYSPFPYYTKEETYSLYEFLNERIFNIKKEDIKDEY